MSAGENLSPLSWAVALAGLAMAPVQVVVATEYLSVEAAQKALFPQADTFTEVVLSLSAAQRDEVAKLAGPQPPHRSLRVWKAMHGGELAGYVFVDEVIGREDFITYAAGIDAAGSLGALEVLAYRETAGRSEAMPGGASSRGATASGNCAFAPTSRTSPAPRSPAST
jgi:hypothetical protein